MVAVCRCILQLVRDDATRRDVRAPAGGSARGDSAYVTADILESFEEEGVNQSDSGLNLAVGDVTREVRCCVRYRMLLKNLASCEVLTVLATCMCSVVILCQVRGTDADADDAEAEVDEELSLNDTELMLGLLDIVVVMWTVIAPALKKVRLRIQRSKSSRPSRFQDSVSAVCCITGLALTLYVMHIRVQFACVSTCTCKLMLCAIHFTPGTRCWCVFQPENADIKQRLEQRFQVALTEFLRAFHQPAVVTSLILLAGFLPASAVPLLR